MRDASLDIPTRLMSDVRHLDGIPLTCARRGTPLVVVDIEQAAAVELAREGLIPGSHLQIVSRVPLGGPLIVQLGRVRLALGAALAAAIRAAPREAWGTEPGQLDG